ncbi:MAG: hypothetical protein ABIH03_04645 [Pseudomonadota bacterium]
MIRAKIDPKTGVKSAIIPPCDVAAVYKAAEVLLNVGLIGDDKEALQLAETLSKWMSKKTQPETT